MDSHLQGSTLAPTEVVADPDYGATEYWNARYQQLPAAYEWYAVDLFDMMRTSTALAAVFERLRTLGSPLRALEVGCGTSAIGVQLASLPSFARIVCVDVSPVVVDLMQRRHAAPPLLTFVCADATELGAVFAPSSFQLIFDKGCLDALSCRREPQMRRYMEQVWQLLDPAGAFVLVSHGALRTPLFDFAFEGECAVLPADGMCEKDTYLYLLRRRPQMLAPDMATAPADEDIVDGDGDDAVERVHFNVNPAFDPN